MASRTAYSTWAPQKPTLFDGHYLRNRSTLDIGVLGYIGIVHHKEHYPEVLSIRPGTSCIYIQPSHITNLRNVSDDPQADTDLHPRRFEISAAPLR